MSVRWDDLCFFCPLYTYCDGNYGETCEYANKNWQEVRGFLKSELDLLEEEK